MIRVIICFTILLACLVAFCAPHPSTATATKMIEYVITLTDQEGRNAKIVATGILNLDGPVDDATIQLAIDELVSQRITYSWKVKRP